MRSYSLGPACVRVVPRPALAQLLSAAAGAGGDGLLSRRARAALRRSTEGFAVAGLSLALFGGREHEIAERGGQPSMKLLPFVCGRRSVPWLRLYCLLATAFGTKSDGEMEQPGPVSGAVLSTTRARRTAPSNQQDDWRC